MLSCVSLLLRRGYLEISTPTYPDLWGFPRDGFCFCFFWGNRRWKGIPDLGKFLHGGESHRVVYKENVKTPTTPVTSSI